MGTIERSAKTIRSKAGRLALLLRLRQDRLIEGQSLRDIARVLNVNASTVMRDLRVLDQVEEEYQTILATQPWVRREYTVKEFAEAIGADPETVRLMIRDGLIHAEKRTPGSRWFIPATELERWKK